MEMYRASFGWAGGGDGGSILTQIMVDEFNCLWSKIRSYVAPADAELVPVLGQLELHSGCRYGVLLSPCFVLSIWRRSNRGDRGIGVT